MTGTDIDGTAEEILGAVPAGATPEEIEAAKPDPSVLAVRPDVEGDEFRVMDALDEAQILDAILGNASDVMVYSFSAGGKQQTGLSWQGVAECVREQNARGHTAIRVSGVVVPQLSEYQEPDEHGNVQTFIRALVYAEDVRNGGGQWGLASQAKMMTYNQERNPGRKPTLDPFAATKALSKAQRNAQVVLVPLVFRQSLIAAATNQPSKVQQIRLGRGHAAAIGPPPLTDEKAVAVKGEIRGVYDQIKALDPMRLLPGNFNAKLTYAESEHARLEDLLAELVSMRDWLASEAAKRAAEEAAKDG